MRFEWDEVKNASNFRKLGVWFEEAQTIWADPRATEFYDPEHSTDEDRFIRVGHSRKEPVLLVVFCEKTPGRDGPNHFCSEGDTQGEECL